ncbi:hypothetical protein BD560DRAFT_427476 [Blakeslea trispora]|nr:hypothetical protein BD560DRAFT_427476 [Blakeslea trispora]
MLLKEGFVLVWLYALILIVFFIDLIFIDRFITLALVCGLLVYSVPPLFLSAYSPWILPRYRCLSSVVSMVFTCTSGKITAQFCQCFSLPCHLFLSFPPGF